MEAATSARAVISRRHSRGQDRTQGLCPRVTRWMTPLRWHFSPCPKPCQLQGPLNLSALERPGGEWFQGLGDAVQGYCALCRREC